MGDEYCKGVIPRTYSLSHCDLTANLTLAVSDAISIDQLKGYYKNDDVVAEWKKVEEGICLVIHCHVSGAYALPDLVAEFRYHIFTKELPLVLKAVLHGDSILFKEHPELIDAVVWVYFHSTSKKYNHVECWGPLMDASQRIQGDQEHSSLFKYDVGENRHSIAKWGGPKSIFQALFAFLL
ncbi:hypothetical protein Syun_003389 [Stephania yunnanensis]|uniref:Staygreen protein domain-containing protein n=1 Tax=Stephania yunnanensis TaxID=152371 RepID=A0AAP0PZT5_9MAGN